MPVITLKEAEEFRKVPGFSSWVITANYWQTLCSEDVIETEGITGKHQWSLRLNAALRHFIAICFAVGLHPSDVLDEVSDDYESLALDL